MVREVNVVSYNPDWPDQFQVEADLITDSLGENVNSVHHMGSTAIPGMIAKPTIDILLVVKSHDVLDANQQALGALGYLPKGENGIPGRRYYVRLEGEFHRCHVHAFEEGHPEVERHLLFRDYLRSHPDEAQAYGSLKLKLVEQFPRDPQSYTEAKSEFIREIDQRAAAWQHSLSGEESDEWKSLD